jgi:hypothetical protein
MTDDNLDRLLRNADPYDADRIGDLRGADLTLLEEIMSTPPIEKTPSLVRPRRQRSLRSRLVVGVAAAAAITVAIGVPAWLSERDAADPGNDPGTGPQAVETGDGSTDQIVYSAAAVKAAEKNPRLLIDEPGWVATSVYGFTKDEGTVVFAKGERELEMTWYPADQHAAYYDDRLHTSDPQDVTVAGQPGALFRYSATDFAVMVEPEGGAFVELRTGIGGWQDKADVLATVAKVTKVAVETWLAAMPAEIVLPDGARRAVAAMLADIPKPPGFDASKLENLGPSDRYQLGARLTGAVTCRWIEEWQRAESAGDTAAEERATDALVSSHDWKILQEMDAEGDFPEMIWAYAEALAAGNPPEGKVLVDSTPTTEGHAQALGCD